MDFLSSPMNGEDKSCGGALFSTKVGYFALPLCHSTSVNGQELSITHNALSHNVVCPHCGALVIFNRSAL